MREVLGRTLPPRQTTSLMMVRILLAYGGLLYISPELWHLLHALLDRKLNMTKLLLEMLGQETEVSHAYDGMTESL